MDNHAAQTDALVPIGALLCGRYEIRRTLGVGGMGVVYEAFHVRLGRPVAIKVLLPEYAATSEFQMRFEREARAAANLKSPHVVRVYDVDTSPEGLTFMVMELLEGNDLGQEADARDIPPGELVDWIVQACAGLAEAHEHGIIHRDLKPPNIFLARTPDGGRIAKLVDFGIAKSAREQTSITKPMDGILGTPTFMAPEQIRGHEADARSDIWALGVVLYRLLARAWPFDGATDQGYLAAALVDPPVPLAARRPDLPQGLCDVVMRALEKKPDHRFASAIALASALAPFGAGSAPVQLASRPSLPDGERWRSVPPPTSGPSRARVVVHSDATPATLTLIDSERALPAEGVSAPVTSRARGIVSVVSVAIVGAAVGGLLLVAIYTFMVRPSPPAVAVPSPAAAPASHATLAPEPPEQPGPPPVPPPTAIAAADAAPEETAATKPAGSSRRAPHRATAATPKTQKSAATPPPSADLPPFL